MPIGFLAPIVLTAAPFVVAALVYAYRRKGVGERVVVSSLFLLRQLQPLSPRQKSFSPPLRFYVEMALLGSLLVAAAGLYFKKPTERFAILIDNSSSMESRLVVDGEVTSALARARFEAESFASALSGDAVVSLFRTVPECAEITSRESSPSEAVSEIRSLQVASGADNLAGCVARIMSARSYSSVFVLSDKTAQETPNGKGVTIRNVTEGASPRGNLALESIALRTLAGQQRAVVVGLKRHGAAAAAQVKMMLRGLSDQQVSFTQEALIKDQSQKQVIFKSPPAAAVYEVEISAAGSGEAAIRGDVLSFDNRAAVSNNVSSRSIAVVSDTTGATHGLEAVPGYTVEGYSRVDFDARHARVEAEHDLIVFYKTAPNQLPNQSSLFIIPPADGVFQSGDLLSQQQVASWDEHHPALNYLTMPLLTLDRAVTVRGPAWSEAIVRASSGAVLVAGELEGKRYAALGFDILPYEGGRSRYMSILTLNLIKWLGSGGTGVGFEAVGATLRVPPGASFVSTTVEELLVTERAGARFFVPREGGVYWLTKGDGLVQPVVVNGFEPSESALVDVVDLSGTQRTASEQVPSETPRTFEYWILLGVLVIAALDMGVMLRRGIA